MRSSPLPDSALIGVTLALMLAYALFEPSFEGPDEPDHTRHVQARAEGWEWPSDDGASWRRWGYQIHQPPLYYSLMAGYSRLVRPAFPEAIAINMGQNPRFPFIRHDAKGERFPWSGVHAGLRWLRLPSLLFGLLTGLLVLRLGALLFPEDRHARVLLFALTLLIPNMLQVFATVTNEGLLVLLSMAGLVPAVATLQREGRPSAWLLLGGVALGLAVLTKLSAGLAIAAALGVLSLAAALDGRWLRHLRAAALLLGPAALLGGSLLLANQIEFGDPTRDALHRSMMPAFAHASPAPLVSIFAATGRRLPPSFVADLCWHSVSLPTLGYALFACWALGVVACVALAARPGVPVRRRVALLVAPLTALLAACFLVAVGRQWASLQVRHVLCVWPLLMLAPVLAFTRLDSFWARWRPWLSSGFVVALVCTNLFLLWGFRAFHQPAARQTPDRDYHTFMYTFGGDRAAGSEYVRKGRMDGSSPPE
jgi:4-amino-4-deoxy-L-arabinose transferase-like glycosyltransferase